MRITDLFGLSGIAIHELKLNPVPAETFFISSTSVSAAEVTAEPAIITGILISQTPSVTATAKIYTGETQLLNLHAYPGTVNSGSVYSYSPFGGLNCLSGINVTFQTNGTNNNGGLTINYLIK